MVNFKTIDDLDLKGKRVLVRVDLNVPMNKGKITDQTRAERVIPTVKEILEKGAGVILASHLGRPHGKVIPDYSLKPLIPILQTLLPNRNITFSPDGTKEPRPGEVILLENLRFNPGEENNGLDFSRFLSGLADIYINDAFSCSHRAHASTEGVTQLLNSAAGRLMEAELQALDLALENPKHPVVAVVGGNKISTKLGLLENLLKKVDHLIVAGAMANTFLYALGNSVGRSICEASMANVALDVMENAKLLDCKIHLPLDAVLAKKLEDDSKIIVAKKDSIPSDLMILDIGPDTVSSIITLLNNSRTLLWNGPLGAFEFKPFDEGTNRIAQAAADLTTQHRLATIAGGGDTMAALKNAQVSHSFSYISSAGGAFLEWLEGKKLPGITPLLNK